MRLVVMYVMGTFLSLSSGNPMPLRLSTAGQAKLRAVTVPNLAELRQRQLALQLLRWGHCGGQQELSCSGL